MREIEPHRLEQHVVQLANVIGPRLAGSEAEAAAAAYVAGTFREAGGRVNVETFAVGSRRIESQSLAFEIDGTWRETPCSVISGSRGTGGEPVEAPVTIVEPPSLRRPSYDGLAGKAVLLLATHVEDPEHYRRLMAARPAFLILVDVRYPSDDVRADGLFPAYVHRYGAVPTVSIPYMRAWALHDPNGRPRSARLRITGGTVASSSQNVIAELPADDGSAGPVIYATAHHDTQADSPGADDNATGVAALLELARVLAPEPRRRAVRLISFGTEEQLSVGSASYVRAHRGELERRGGYVCNFDSFGSRMGWFNVSTCLESASADRVRAYLDERGQYAELSNEVSPYQDAFPFHAAGIGGHWVYRRNCTAGRFFHHQRDDEPDKLDFAMMAPMVAAHAGMIAEWSQAETLPVSHAVPAGLRDAIERYWTDCFGGWAGFG